MERLNYFETRKECKEFLDQFNFKYFIPYLEDFTSYNVYYVELNEDCSKIRYCELETLRDGMVYNKYCFYDADNASIKTDNGWKPRYQLAEDGEADRKELKELEKYII